MLLLSLLCALSPPAHAARRNKEAPPPPSPPVAAPQPVPVGPALWPDGLPTALGPLPEGLANLSAQGCRACHPDEHAAWADGHGGSARSEPWRSMARGTGDPACVACHLPLAEQHVGERFDAGLSLEGVTCAACHVRDGVVLTATAVDAPQAPHPLAHAPELKDGTVCAACHALTWDGASAPLYDTWSQWSASPYAEAGVGCDACHAPHGAPLPLGQAVSVLLDVDRVTVVRGEDPLSARVTLQNTGAGHPVPAGSPHRTLHVVIALEHEESDARIGEHRTTLGRTLSEGPPWAPVSDTRLQVGESRTIEWSAVVDQDAPGGRWSLAVTLVEELAGVATDGEGIERRLPVDVQ